MGEAKGELERDFQADFLLSTVPDAGLDPRTTRSWHESDA